MICDDQHTTPYVVGSLHVGWGLLKKGLGPFQTLVALMVKNVPAMPETQVQSLSSEDPWSREWQFISVFLPGEFQGQRSLAGYSPWVAKCWT